MSETNDMDGTLRVQTIKPPQLKTIDVEHVLKFEDEYAIYCSKCTSMGSGSGMTPTPMVQCIEPTTKTMIALSFGFLRATDLQEDHMAKWLIEFKSKSFVKTANDNEGALDGLTMQVPKLRAELLKNANEYIRKIIERLQKNGVYDTVAGPTKGSEVRKKLVPKMFEKVWPLAASGLLLEEWHAQGKSTWSLGDIFEHIRNQVVINGKAKLKEEEMLRKRAGAVGEGRRSYNRGNGINRGGMRYRNDDRGRRSGGYNSGATPVRSGGYNSGTTPVTRENENKRRVVTFQHKQGQNKRSYDESNGKDQTVLCYECGQYGHISRNCKAPAWKRNKHKSQRETARRVRESLKQMRNDDDNIMDV